MQNSKETTALVWFRNDLRIQDNYALNEACLNNSKVVGIYCIDPRFFEFTSYGFRKTEVYRAEFLLQSIKNLSQQLRALNINLHVYFEQPENAIPRFCESKTISSIYYQDEWTQEEKDVELSLRKNLPERIVFQSFYNQFLFHPEDIPFSYDVIPQVFTVFRKALESKSKVRTLQSPIAMPGDNYTDMETSIPTLNDLGFNPITPHQHTAFPFKGGESNALSRLDDYFFKTKKLGVYKKTRNGLIGKDYSSKFSPWLANGCISPRTIYWNVKQFEKDHFKNDSTYWLIFELIWRDYFKYISLKHGNKIFLQNGIKAVDYDWDINQTLINQWINGETPEPFVNANMIELKETGWMSNRGRQNVASYFAKDLLQDWRIGATYFEAMLLDYDVHSNYGNWLYVSGVGNDPRDRKFNVKLQAERYDNNHKYRNMWLQTSLF